MSIAFDTLELGTLHYITELQNNTKLKKMPYNGLFLMSKKYV